MRKLILVTQRVYYCCTIYEKEIEDYLGYLLCSTSTCLFFCFKKNVINKITHFMILSLQKTWKIKVKIIEMVPF